MVVVLESRELAMGGLRSIAVSDGMVIAASSLGKIKTAYQSTALGFLLWHHRTIGIDAHSVGIVLLWIAMFFSIVSFLEYAYGFWRFLHPVQRTGE
jgi:CDP-diacylglycerol--glycerol-3-phosphate 3-phosphatidyltransferase